MTRLIDAETLKRAIDMTEQPKWTKELTGITIDKCPTVNAVEVIRCAKCKWYFCGGCKAISDERAVSPTDYCSWAERKETS